MELVVTISIATLRQNHGQTDLRLSPTKTADDLWRIRRLEKPSNYPWPWLQIAFTTQLRLRVGYILNSSQIFSHIPFNLFIFSKSRAWEFGPRKYTPTPYAFNDFICLSLREQFKEIWVNECRIKGGEKKNFNANAFSSSFEGASLKFFQLGVNWNLVVLLYPGSSEQVTVRCSRRIHFSLPCLCSSPILLWISLTF